MTNAVRLIGAVFAIGVLAQSCRSNDSDLMVLAGSTWCSVSEDILLGLDTSQLPGVWAEVRPSRTDSFNFTITTDTPSGDWRMSDTYVGERSDFRMDRVVRFAEPQPDISAHFHILDGRVVTSPSHGDEPPPLTDLQSLNFLENPNQVRACSERDLQTAASAEDGPP